ncbi:myoferlin-like isoform X3 [Clavelina lepadiformis]|uniref:myoferlin-like isoform X3 n=1 Tax=Clavelina lepadiformis TaxID=159417 RepID=UPI0040420DCC
MTEVKIKVVRADLGKSAKIKSPFVSLTLKGQTKKTQSLSGTSPNWNELLTFNLSEVPAPTDEIKVEVYDDDGFLGIDKLFGHGSVTYNGLKLSKEKGVDLKMKKGILIPGARVILSTPDDGKDGGEGDSKEARRKSSVGAKKDKEGKDDKVDEGFSEGGEKHDLNGGSGGGAHVSGGADRSSLSEKPEDFQVRVRLVCGRQLSGSNIKPVVKVTAGKSQVKTSRIRKGSSPIWNEMLMFNFHESLKDLYDFIFEFSVNNSRKMRSDSLIGSFKLDVGSVYDQPGHAYVRKWILLTDPEDASNTPKGYLKITICVLGAGDQPPEDKGDGDDDDVEGNLLTPAGASLRSATFTMRIFSAEDLPQMDSSAFKSMKKFMGMGEDVDISKTLVDPYVVFSFAGKKRKTRVVEGKNNPEWNQELSLPIKFPSMCESIRIVIRDWDRVGADDTVGTFVIPISRISSTGEDASGADMDEDDFDDLEGFLPTFGPTFVNFYGSPREFSEISDPLDALNLGKGVGCAYRGRAMVELTTSIDEEGSEPIPPIQEVAEDHIALTQKYLRRRRYRLVMGFESADLIDKAYENVEFEVSMGNYGNKFDVDLGTSCSLTEATNPIFDGCKYHFCPWASKKPVMMVTSQWEDINFRLHAVNVILRLADRIDMEVEKVKDLIENGGTDIEIASEIVAVLDMLILETAKRLPDPRGRPEANQLDLRIHQQRTKTFKAIADEAADLRQNCTDAHVAMQAITDFQERLHIVAYEPQNSLPDVIIWMITGNKRIAFARIPAYNILHAREKPEYSGRFCSKPQTICLRYPTSKTTGKKQYKIPCQLRIIAWLGLAREQDDFDFYTRGQISVYADTFEIENSIPIRGWTPDGFKDITGEIPLPKNSFECPSGWEWEGDWEKSSELNLLRDAGHSTYMEECFEHEARTSSGDWVPQKYVNGSGDIVESTESISCAKGWEWDDNWKIDTNRACDEDGWEYSAPVEDFGQLAWIAVEKSFHVMRRRRLVRNRKCVDPKVIKRDDKTEQMLGEGWEYATTLGSQFHLMPKMLDLVRRRRWIRKMVTSGTGGSSAIFNLDTALIKGTMDFEPTPIPTPIRESEESRKALAILGATEEAQEEERDRAGKKFFGRKKSKADPVLAAAAAERKKKLKMPAPKIYIMFSVASKLQLRAYVYQARDLLAMDQDNFSDPVIFVSFLNQCRRTVVMSRTLNPVWDQTLMMDITYYGDLQLLRQYCNDVVIEVYDKDDVSHDRAKKERANAREYACEVPGCFAERNLHVFRHTKAKSKKVVCFDHKHYYGDKKGAVYKLSDEDGYSSDSLTPSYDVTQWKGHVSQRKGNFQRATTVRNSGSKRFRQIFSKSAKNTAFEIMSATSSIRKSLRHRKYRIPTGNMEFMGRTRGQPVIKFGAEDEDRAVLSWHEVKKNKVFGGSILAAFELFLKHEKQEMPLPPPRRKDVHMVPYGIRPVLQRTAIEFLIWGVRNMQPFQMLSVDTPSVLIQVGEVEIKTRIIKSLKKNPNFSQPLFFATANLPLEQLYFPPIVIRVKDNRKFGRRPTVGQHIITNVSGYRIKPIAAKLQTTNDGNEDEGIQEDGISQDVAIEVERPRMPSLGISFGKLKTTIRKEEIDWWSKYYASIGETDKCGDFDKSGLDKIKIYKNELEKQENYNHFHDFIETFKLSRGKVEEDEEPEFAGEFKGSFRIYELPADPNAPFPPRYFEKIPSTEAVDVKVRIYVIRGFDLAPQDSNGLADPYLKIKVGKKRIDDRDNYLANTLEPTFGRMFEVDLKLPMEKDLYVQVYDWDLIGTDDKIGETKIDIENRYLSKYKAWCSLPESYYTSGPTPWRDQMTPKDWLYDKARREGWDEPIWNGNTCVMLNRKTYKLSDLESKKKPSPYWGDPDERLALYILRTFPHVSEHVETRPLFSKLLPGIEQGRVHLWIDMFPKDYGDPGEPFNVTPRTPSKYYARVIIWNCSDIPMMDTSMLGDEMTDIYFKGWLSGLEHKKQKTDVHYRSLDGTGMFNWRFLFPFEYLPQEKLHYVSKKEHLWSLDKTVSKFPPVLNIQVWDNDLFGPNEYISELSLPLNNMAKCCKFRRSCTIDNVPDLQGNCNMDMISMFDQKLLKGWWPLYRMVDGEKQQAGKLEMSLEIVTEDEHEEKPAGQGRDEPNQNPKLDKPNRPATSFAWFSSPFKSFRYIIWRKYKWIMIGLLVLILVVIFLILFFYSFPNEISKKVVDLF